MWAKARDRGPGEWAITLPSHNGGWGGRKNEIPRPGGGGGGKGLIPPHLSEVTALIFTSLSSSDISTKIATIFLTLGHPN